MKEITMTPIGIIDSPYKQVKDMPIQGKFLKASLFWKIIRTVYLL